MSNLEEGIKELTLLTEPFLAASRGYLATSLLREVTDSLIARKREIERYGECFEALIDPLKIHWMAACLCTNWSEQEKGEIKAALSHYQQALDDGGLIFGEVLTALKHGWKLPLLQGAKASDLEELDWPDYVVAAKRLLALHSL